MDETRHIYLQTMPICQALDRVKNAINRDLLLGQEKVPTHQACGRVTAEPVYAKYSSPTYHSAAMDGIAVKASDTFQAREGNPIQLYKGKNYEPINTGDPLPDYADAVIMIEYVHLLEDETAEIESPAFPWQHVRKIGEDIVATELIIPQNHLLTAYDIGALLSGGIWELMVRQEPHLYIIPTGDEVLNFEDQPEPSSGEVIESNSQVLKALAQSWNVTVTRVPPVPDKESLLIQEVKKALDSEAQIIILGAGSSAGSKDYTRQIMEKMGEILVHGIAAMPGKPTLIGKSGEKIMIGAPGYPVSSIICFEEILHPLLNWLNHRPSSKRQRVPVTLTRKLPSKLGQEEFLRLSIGQVGPNRVATPLPRGAGIITSVTKAQGIARIPSNSEGKMPGEELEAELLVAESELDQVLVCIGSHDNTLDLLANELMGLDNPVSFASTHVGSLGGLNALKNGSAHLAGSHLFDPESQDYNFPFFAKYLENELILVVNLAIRHQGLMVAKGNPKNIQEIQDLSREDVRFINRQRGAGTRILLDEHLKQAGISVDQVKGYSQEEYTHMAIAVNVLSGAADCGMGIYAACKALDLDFVPLARERYDLIIPEVHQEDPKIQTLLQLIRSEDFQAKVRDLGGYETYLTGQIMEPGQGLSEK